MRSCVTLGFCCSLQIGVDFALKVINWDANTLIRLQLWDIAGAWACYDMYIYTVFTPAHYFDV